MQPTEPTPSTAVQQPEAQAEAAEPSSKVEDSASAPPWWRRVFSRQEPDSTETEEPTPPPPAARTYSEEEFHRSVQAETDRREAKRQRDQAAADRRRLRDEDPWSFAEQERQAEQVVETDGQINTLFANISQAHDAVTLDPLVQRLAPEDRQRILALQGAGTGLDGRKLIAEESLSALEKHWRAAGRAEAQKDAEQNLRRNQAFRKQLFAEMRGLAPEPELLPASGGSNGSDRDVSKILRAQIGLR